MDLVTLILLFFAGFAASEVLRQMTRREDDQEPDALPPAERILLLPAAPDEVLGHGNGPYRESEQLIIIDEPALQLPKQISFPDFVGYWQIVGLPEKPGEDQDFVSLAHRIKFDSPKKLAKWLTIEVENRLEPSECKCEYIEQQVFSQALIHAAATRNSARDAWLLSQVMKRVGWSELKYILVLAVAEIWPIGVTAAQTISEMTEWRRNYDLDATERINRCARAALDKWKEVDPLRFSALSQQML